MIKTTFITLMSVGAIGTGATTLSPEVVTSQKLELAVGSTRVIIAADGIETRVADKAEFAIALCKGTDRVLTVRF